MYVCFAYAVSVPHHFRLQLENLYIFMHPIASDGIQMQ